ncbi:AAA family ATPase [Siccirubricoccus deserti]
MDPILGRDAELEQAIDILMRRRQNNPLLVGEPGVGKTAIAEALAQRIAAGAVPGPLKPMAVRSLDLGLLQAGAGVRGVRAAAEIRGRRRLRHAGDSSMRRTR